MFNMANYLLHQERGKHEEIDRRENCLKFFIKDFSAFVGDIIIDATVHCTIKFIIQFSNKKIFKNLKTIRTRIQDVQICFSRPSRESVL